MTRRAALVIGAWGLANIALSTLMFAFTSDVMSHVVYWAANVIVLGAAAVAWAARDAGRRTLPEASAGVVVLAVAVALMGIGAGIGSWAALLGAAALVVALFVLATERRAS